jgi:large subunit ribosomal protein L7/L12
MTFLDRLLGGKPRATDDTVYHDGDQIPCGACGKKVKVKYFPKGNVFIGGPEAVRGIVLRCQKCGFITCIDCAMKPMAGQVQSCPSCKAMLGPTVLTQGVDILARKPRAASSESTAPSGTVHNVVLVAAGERKIQVMKVLREFTGLGVKEVKELVEGAPKPVKEKVSKAEAAEIQRKLEEMGATVEVT